MIRLQFQRPAALVLTRLSDLLSVVANARFYFMNPKKQTLSHSQALAGFTLTELLVVIVVIVTLAALSFVGVQTIRQSANSARCVENLRTWGAAIHGYAAENNGLVQWYEWASIGSPARHYENYLGGDRVSATATMDGRSVLSTQMHRRCPSQNWDGTGNGPVGYAMTRPNPKVPSVSTYNLSTANDPSQLLLMIDANVLNLNGPDDISTAVLPLCVGSSSRHRNKVNALFGDGHITAYQAADLNANSKQKKAMVDRWFTLK